MPIMSKEEFDVMVVEAYPAQCAVELWWLVEHLNALQPARCLEIGGWRTQCFWSFFAPTVSLTLAQYSSSDVPQEPQEFSGFEEVF